MSEGPNSQLVTLHLGQVHSLLDGVPDVTGLHLEGTL